MNPYVLGLLTLPALAGTVAALAGLGWALGKGLNWLVLRLPARRDDISARIDVAAGWPQGGTAVAEHIDIGPPPGADPTPDGCPHCPDDHRDPTSRHWGVYVGSQRDGAGRPTHLMVAPSAGGHVAESDAAWLWHLMRETGRA